MPAPRRRPSTNDLFEIFPDLPTGVRRSTAAENVERIKQQVRATRERARANIQRQRSASEGIRAAIRWWRRRP